MHTEPAPLTPEQRRRGIIACIAATTTITITLGLSWPLLAIVLERQGVPTWLNGLSASAQMTAILAVAPLGPRLIGWLGVTRVMRIGVAGMLISLALLPIFPNVWAWFPIRFFLGLATELTFVGGDIWINQLAREKSRGRLLGVHGMFLHAGFALGPATIALVGTQGWLALYIGMVVICLSFVPLYWAKDDAPTIEGKPRARIMHFLRIAPTVMVAALMFGLVDSAVLSLLPIYGIGSGLDAEASALLLTAFVIGGVCGQLPLGWLADHMDRRTLLAVCAMITLVTIALLPYVIDDTVATWLVMIVMGVVVGSFYLVTMAMIGARFRGADLIGINAGFVFLWGIGDVLGPAISGTSMEVFGPNGMPLAGAILCGAFIVLIVRRMRSQL